MGSWGNLFVFLSGPGWINELRAYEFFGFISLIFLSGPEGCPATWVDMSFFGVNNLPFPFPVLGVA